MINWRLFVPLSLAVACVPPPGDEPGETAHHEAHLDPGTNEPQDSATGPDPATALEPRPPFPEDLRAADLAQPADRLTDAVRISLPEHPQRDPDDLESDDQWDPGELHDETVPGGASGWEDASDLTSFVPGSFGQVPWELPRRPMPLASPYQPWTSSGAIAVDDSFLYLADADHDRLVVLHRRDGTLARVVEVGAQPHHVVAAPNGDVYASLARGAAVARVRGDDVRTLPVGVDPRGLALAPHGRHLYVAVTGPSLLVTIDTADFTVVGEQPSGVDRPVAVAATLGRLVVTGTGTRAAVHRLGAGLPSETPLRVRLRTGAPMDDILRLGRSAVAVSNRAVSVAVQPDDGDMLILHQQAIPNDQETRFRSHSTWRNPDDPDPRPRTQGYYEPHPPAYEPQPEWPHLLRGLEPAVTRLNSEGNTPRSSALPTRDPVTGEPMTAWISNPVHIAHHPTHALAFVVGYSSDTVLVMTTHQRDPMETPLAILDVNAGPTAVAFSPDGRHAYVLGSVDYTVVRIDLRPLLQAPQVAPPVARAVNLREPQPPSNPGDPRTTPQRLRADRQVQFAPPRDRDQRLGLRLFSYARSRAVSVRGQFVCASCHPDGQDDGLRWGRGTMNQTPTLAGRVGATQPYGWDGAVGNLHQNIARSLERMGGTGLSYDSRFQLAAYVRYELQPPPNPFIRRGLTPKQERGRAIFDSDQANCTQCHPRPTYADGLNHAAIHPDVPSWLEINTPSLKGLFHSAPYLHDGSAATLHDVFRILGDSMGQVSHLTPEDIDDLVAYLLTL